MMTNAFEEIQANVKSEWYVRGQAFIRVVLLPKRLARVLDFKLCSLTPTTYNLGLWS